MYDDINILFHAQAKEMVTLSKTIANKIKDKQGEVTDDEVGMSYALKE